ncbi:MAG: hypothetical protein HPY72_10340 [Anaerolineae bacterium]|nr:hypothetical protein [Anaerolineae bacterium]
MDMRRGVRIFIAGILLLTVLACRISFGGSENKEDAETKNLKLQLTVQALQMTQAASANNQAQSAPAQPPAQQVPAQQAAAQPQPKPQTQKDTDDDEDKDDDEEEDETPCNSSKYVSETIKDGTVFDAGENFEKSWTLRNAGDCDWNEDYEFVFEEGDRMGGEKSIKVNTVIEPNETITFKVHLTAPDDPGDYTGVWRLKSDDGEKLGKYWVKIHVGGAPAGPFAVTSVTFSTAAQPIHIDCPDNVKVTAKITTSGAGTVTYKWTDCEGGSSNGSITFDSAGTKSVSHNVNIGWSDPAHWASLYIDNPNHQDFGTKYIDVICNP